MCEFYLYCLVFNLEGEQWTLPIAQKIDLGYALRDELYVRVPNPLFDLSHFGYYSWKGE